MPVVGLDTTFLADVLRHDADAIRQLKAFSGATERHVTTALNAAELYQGAASPRRGAKAIEEIDDLLAGSSCFRSTQKRHTFTAT